MLSLSKLIFAIFSLITINSFGLDLTDLPDGPLVFDAKACENQRVLVSKENLKNQLRKMNIEIKTDGDIFDSDFLMYLGTFFKVIPPSSAISLHATQESGSKLVNSKQQGSTLHLYFTKNAGDAIVNRKWNELFDAFCKGMVNTNRLPIQFSNLLFQQLIQEVSSEESLIRYIRSSFGLTVISEKRDNYDSFTKNELAILVKQLKDLPNHITKQFNINAIYRYHKGSTLRVNQIAANAVYQRETKFLILADSAFEDQNSLFGAGTFLHELGHSLEMSLSSSFIKEFKNAAITELWQEDQKTFSEDFADSFSMYLNKPEQLRSVFPKRYKLIQEILFHDFEYFSDGFDRTKLKLESTKEDFRPIIERSILECMKISIEELSSEKFFLKTEFKCIDGDFSNLEKLSIKLIAKDSGSKNGIYYELTPEKNRQTEGRFFKNYFLLSTQEYRFQDIEAGEYKLDFVIATDKNKKSAFFNIDGFRSFYINGKKPAKSRLNEIAIENIAPLFKIQDVSTHYQSASYILLIPKSFSIEGLNKIYLQFINRDQKEIKLRMTISNDQILTSDIGTKYFIFAPSDSLINGTYELSNLEFQFNTTSKFRNESVQFGSIQQIQFKLDRPPGNADNSQPLIDVNNVTATLQATKSTRAISETQVLVPIQGLSSGFWEIKVMIQAPDGYLMTGSISGHVDWLSNYKKSGPETYLIPVNVLIEPGHGSGTYLIHSIQAQEQHQAASFFRVNNEYRYVGELKSERQTTESLIDRKITRSIEIGPKQESLR